MANSLDRIVLGRDKHTTRQNPAGNYAEMTPMGKFSTLSEGQTWPCSIRIGTAGWSLPRQHGNPSEDTSSHLVRYSAILACSEINSSFRRLHRPSTYARWAASTPPEFRFSVKAPGAITHEGGLAPNPDQLQAFLNEVSNLGDKLGPILFQLPPRLSLDELGACQFFDLFRRLFPVGFAALEPRHSSWFSPAGDRLLREFHIARVVADPPRSSEGLHPAGCLALTYYRLHGSPRVYYSTYSEEWLSELVPGFTSLQKTSEVWCIFDNTASGAAIENALILNRDLNLSG
jgi:uncharacterized protein YecE (DUF72 family)